MSLISKVPEGALKARLVEMIALVNRLLAQKLKDKKKLYSLHEPAVDCISKGKAHKRYEFGTKVSVTTTNRGGFWSVRISTCSSASASVWPS